MTPRDIEAIPLCDIPEESVEWLWRPYVPLGECTLIAGDGGVAKTYLALAVASAVTNGSDLPGAEIIPKGNVIFVTEDDLGKTVKQRFRQLKGDDRRFFCLEHETLV